MRVISETKAERPMRIVGYCVLSNHWHLVLLQKRDGDLTDFMSWMARTHTMRRHVHRNTVGTGHLYQGRFKVISNRTGTSTPFCAMCSATRQFGKRRPRVALVQFLGAAIWRSSSARSSFRLARAKDQNLGRFGERTTNRRGTVSLAPQRESRHSIRQARHGRTTQYEHSGWNIRCGPPAVPRNKKEASS